MKHKTDVWYASPSHESVPNSLNTQNPIAGKNLKMIEELLQKTFGCAVVTELRLKKGC